MKQRTSLEERKEMVARMIAEQQLQTVEVLKPFVIRESLCVHPRVERRDFMQYSKLKMRDDMRQRWDADLLLEQSAVLKALPSSAFLHTSTAYEDERSRDLGTAVQGAQQAAQEPATAVVISLVVPEATQPEDKAQEPMRVPSRTPRVAPGQKHAGGRPPKADRTPEQVAAAERQRRSRAQRRVVTE